MAGKYPILNWNRDNYADWLLTNSASLNTQKTYGAVSLGIGGLTFFGATMGILYQAMAMTAGLASGGALLPLTGMALGGLIGTFNGAQQIETAMSVDNDHSKIPDSASGLASGGDINVCSDRAGFFFYKYSIKREFAEMIDHYFDMYGYKVNSLEVPNLTSRINWNYLKVIDPNIEGDIIPDKDINKFKQMLQNGVTFWHNINTFRDYSQNNGNS